MPEIRPFRGVRYDVARVGMLADVVAPPYDVIGEGLQARLYDRSPYNIIRVELNRQEAQDASGEDRYRRAAAFLNDWLKQGVLREEDHPALYVYSQEFEVEGQTYLRRGFLARVRVQPLGQGQVYAHEETLSGPKADRLALYHATGFNISPIFGLYPDPEGGVLKSVEAGIRDRTPLEVRDDLGVIHRLWPVYDPVAHTEVQRRVSALPVFIADGHHRYETAVRYLEERAASGQLKGEDDPAHHCLMMLVGMSDPGLQILPTHRLVSGLPGLGADRLATLLEGEFDITRVGRRAAGAQAAWEMIESTGDQDTLGFGTRADGEWLIAKLRSDATMDRLAPAHSADWRSLGVSILQELVLGHLLGKEGDPRCRYVHLMSEVLEDLGAGGCDVACLVAPASMEHVATIASTLEKMPPKSTYFYPKLLTGMVLNPIAPRS